MFSNNDFLKIKFSSWNMHVADDLYDFHSNQYDENEFDLPFNDEYEEYYFTRNNKKEIELCKSQEDLNIIFNYKCEHNKKSDEDNKVHKATLCDDPICKYKKKNNSKLLFGLQYDNENKWFLFNSAYSFNSIFSPINLERLYTVVEDFVFLESKDIIKLGRIRLKLENVSQFSY